MARRGNPAQHNNQRPASIAIFARAHDITPQHIAALKRKIAKLYIYVARHNGSYFIGIVKERSGAAALTLISQACLKDLAPSEHFGVAPTSTGLIPRSVLMSKPRMANCRPIVKTD